METVKLLLFERPAAIYWALFFAELICLLALWRLRSRRALLAALVPAVLAGLVLGVSHLVVTERERLMAATDGLRIAAVAGDMAAFGSLIDKAYEDGEHGKAEVVDAVQFAVKRLGLEAVKWDHLELAVDGPDGQVSFRAFLHTSKPLDGMRGGPLMMRWRLWWARRPGGWRVVSSRLDEPAGVPGAPRGPRR